MTTEPCSQELLEALAAFVEKHLGLNFPPSRWRDLTKGLTAAAQELGCPDLASLAQQLLNFPLRPEALAVLAGHLTIGETYFFREKGMFHLLANHILPPLLAARRNGDRRLRLWSAGCASGEEAYSLAITLHQHIPDWQNWQILLLATDVNPRALARARQGIYSRWSFRGVPTGILAAYFEPLPGDRWRVKPWLKELITFALLNLARDLFPSPDNNTSDLDIIFCRNVLMYLSPEATSRIVKNFAAAVREGGWLMVSPAECSLIQEDCFRPRHHAMAIPFQKVTPSAAGRLATGARSSCGTKDLALPSQPLAWASPAQSGASVACQPVQVQEGNRLSCPAAVPAGETVSTRTTAPAVSVEADSNAHDTELARLRRLAEAGGDAAAMAALARHYANLGQLAEADLWGEKAICQDCLNPHYYYLRAAILVEQNRPAEASQLLKQALYLQHDFVLAHFSLGRLALEEQRLPEALRHFNNALFILNNCADEDPVPAAEGLTMGALRQVVVSIKNRLTAEGKTTAER
ncbi:MAG: CheR family methyltransferase [Desulfobacca sp.]|uniref:CheR family methyltransferase n=1 Tax=Desulfobacca sp. TaxID=2067990 RepID=UPI00404953E6